MAEDLGNTLATYNLAWKLITSGFLPEARQRLQSKLEAPDLHRNVLDALGGIARQQQTEETKRETITKHAGHLARIRTRLAESLVEGMTLNPGSYTFSQGSNRLQFQIDTNGGIRGELSGLLVSQIISGKAEGITIRFTWETPKPQSTSSILLGSFQERGFGLFVMEENTCWGYMVDGDFKLDPTQERSFVECHFVQTN